MTIAFNVKGEVKITMFIYINNLVTNTPEIYKESGGFATPVPEGKYETYHDDNTSREQLYNDKKRNTASCLSNACIYQRVGYLLYRYWLYSTAPGKRT